jgi:hypothetical protein
MLPYASACAIKANKQQIRYLSVDYILIRQQSNLLPKSFIGVSSLISKSISTDSPDSSLILFLGAVIENGLAPVRPQRHQLVFEPNRNAGNPVPTLREGHESDAPAPHGTKNLGVRATCQ